MRPAVLPLPPAAAGSAASSTACAASGLRCSSATTCAAAGRALGPHQDSSAGTASAATTGIGSSSSWHRTLLLLVCAAAPAAAAARGAAAAHALSGRSSRRPATGVGPARAAAGGRDRGGPTGAGTCSRCCACMCCDVNTAAGAFGTTRARACTRRAAAHAGRAAWLQGTAPRHGPAAAAGAILLAVTRSMLLCTGGVFTSRVVPPGACMCVCVCGLRQCLCTPWGGM